MKKIVILCGLLGLSSSYASGIDTKAVLGGALGGATGAAVGSSIGGRDGAIIGSAIGAAAGTAITAKKDRPVVQQRVRVVEERPVEYRYKKSKRGHAYGHQKHRH